MRDKQHWPTVPFADVVRLNTERVNDPAAAGIERYVGIEHIEPEDLRIRRWGLVAEGTTFTNRFRPGQVLFAKRRAYQRKVALADFEGVCSGDIYVLETRDPAVLLPELLPFICQTDSFFHHAVDTSAGSLSPRTNWSRLAAYEFPLPPPDEQRRLVGVLRAFRDTEEALRECTNGTEALERSFLVAEFGRYFDILREWEPIPLGELAVVQSGVAKGRPQVLGVTVEKRYITVSNVQDGFLDLTDVKTITVEKDKVSQYLLQIGDVLMTEGGDPDKLGRGTVWNGEIPACVHQNHIFAVRPDQVRLNPWFLAAVAKSPYGKDYFLSCAKRTSNLATINKQQVRAFLVPNYDMERQHSLVARWQSIRTALDSFRDRTRRTRLAYTSFLNSAFGSE